MILINKVQIIEEQVEVKEGTYYFEDDNLVVYKFSFTEDEHTYSDYKFEEVKNFSNIYSITFKEDWSDGIRNLPYKVEQFLLKKEGKEITEQLFNTEKEEVINKLLKQINGEV
jgi:hypothetical protein